MRIVPLIAVTLGLTCSPTFAKPAQEDVRALVKKQADQLLANVHANVYAPDMRVNIALEELTIANQEIQKEDKYTFLSGCRPQSCGEKAAAVLNNATQQLLAAALLSYNCKDDILAPEEITYLTTRQPGKKPALHCAHDPILMVYIVRRSIEAPALYEERALAERLQQWGKKFGYQGELIRIVNLY